MQSKQRVNSASDILSGRHHLLSPGTSCPIKSEQKLKLSVLSSQNYAKQELIAKKRTLKDASRRFACIHSFYNSLIHVLFFKSSAPSVARKDVDELVRELVGGASSIRAPESNNESPLSSVPGTPVLGQTATLHPQPTAPSILGRTSRQSDAAFDRVSLGTAVTQSTNGATDEVVHRYVKREVVMLNYHQKC